MSDVVAVVCPCVPDDGQWCEMYRAELLCGKEAKDIPEKLVDEVLRKVNVQRAKILRLVPYMHRECIITNDEHQQLTNPQTTELMRGNLLSRILMGKRVHWLLKFCHCLLQSYESERGLDIHYTLLQQIKGDLHYHLKVDPLQQDQGIYAENVASNVKRVPITHDAKERLIRRLNIESHRHLLDYLNQVTTSDVAKAWLSANVTRDWTILVEAMFTEPGLGCSVSGILPLSSSNPPAVWNYVRDMGKEWEHLARFLGYSDSLISEIQTKRNWDVKSQIHSFMRVCLIPDCGERRTEEIMEKIGIFLGHPSQSDHKSVQPPEAKGAAKFRHAVFDNSASLYLEDYQPVYYTDTKGHHVLAKETDHSWGRKFYQDRASPQASPQASLHASPQVFRMDSASTEIKKTSDGRSEERILAMNHSNKMTIPEDSTQEDNGQELLQACMSEQWDVAEALVNSGGMLEGQDKDGRTPLHICCIKGKMKMVKLLIEYGSNVTAKDKFDNCCLHHKETLKNHDVASLVIAAFVEKDNSVDQPNKNDMTPLMVACQSGDICSQAALILITHGARVDGLPNVKDKPLICASARGNAKMVDYLLTYCADINQKDGRDGSTALIQACLCNHPEIVKVLLEREANVNLADKDGTTALAAAVSKNAYEMVQMLIEKAADVNCTRHHEGIGGSHEETPLASACAQGYRDVAELLIHNGANVNFLCSDAVPPIGFAIIYRQQHMVWFLLEVEGYDKSIYGLRIPLDIAVRVENYPAAKILLDARGGPEVALQEAQQNHLFELADRIQIVQSLPEVELSLSAFEEPAVGRAGSFQMRDQAVKVEEVLQTFSQICMAAITSNKDCEPLVEILKAVGAPSHILLFIQEYYRGIQRQDILKAKFLSSDSGMSPANFFITHQFIDTVQFHVHAMEFFPDGTRKFYEELVWTFHQIGGEELPYDVSRVFERLFGGHISLNIHRTTVGQLQEDQCASTTQPQQLFSGIEVDQPSFPQLPFIVPSLSARAIPQPLEEQNRTGIASADPQRCPTDESTSVNTAEFTEDTAQSVSTEKLPASQTDTTEVLSDPSTLEKERKNVFEGMYQPRMVKVPEESDDGLPIVKTDEQVRWETEDANELQPHVKKYDQSDPTIRRNLMQEYSGTVDRYNTKDVKVYLEADNSYRKFARRQIKASSKIHGVISHIINSYKQMQPKQQLLQDQYLLHMMQQQMQQNQQEMQQNQQQMQQNQQEMQQNQQEMQQNQQQMQQNQQEMQQNQQEMQQNQQEMQQNQQQMQQKLQDLLQKLQTQQGLQPLHLKLQQLQHEQQQSRQKLQDLPQELQRHQGLHPMQLEQQQMLPKVQDLLHELQIQWEQMEWKQQQVQWEHQRMHQMLQDLQMQQELQAVQPELAAEKSTLKLSTHKQPSTTPGRRPSGVTCATKPSRIPVPNRRALLTSSATSQQTFAKGISTILHDSIANPTGTRYWLHVLSPFNTLLPGQANFIFVTVSSTPESQQRFEDSLRAKYSYMNLHQSKGRLVRFNRDARAKFCIRVMKPADFEVEAKGGLEEITKEDVLSSGEHPPCIYYQVSLVQGNAPTHEGKFTLTATGIENVAQPDVHLEVPVTLYFAVIQKTAAEKAPDEVSHDIVKSGCIHGVDIIGDTKFTVLIQGGSFEWKGYGLRLHVSKGSLPPDMGEGTISIRVCLSGQFQLPENSDLLSPVFWITAPCKFTKPVTLEIQHCALIEYEEELSNLSFVSARCSQKDLPYRFTQVDGGVFTSHSSYGSIQLRYFSGYAVTGRKNTPKFYCAHLYRTMKQMYDWRFYFVITQDLDVKNMVVREHYGHFAEQEATLRVKFERGEITLSIPEDGLDTKEGWKITPFTYPTISRKDADGFQPGQWIPECQLIVQWKGRDPKPVQLMYKVKLIGAKAPYNYIHLTLNPEPEEHLSRTTGRSVRYNEDLHRNYPSGLDSQPELSDLMNEIAAKIPSRWMDMGLQLGLDQGALDGIASISPGDTNHCYSNVFTRWKNQTHSYTWLTIVQALETPAVGQGSLASTIRSKLTGHSSQLN